MDVASCPPRTITEVAYRLVYAAHEGEGASGRTKHIGGVAKWFPYRQKTQIKDFCLTQCIHITEQEALALWLAHLCIKGAYLDTIEQ